MTRPFSPGVAIVRRTKSRALAAGGLLVALGATSACGGLEVFSARSPGASFANYRTYAHGPPEPTPAGFERNGFTPEVWEMVQRDVDLGLKAKGYTLAAAGAEPDLIVRTSSGERAMERDEGADVHGPQEWVGPDIMARYTQATLVIDATDARTRRAVWHGSSRRALGPVPTVSEASIAGAVRAILRNFPPEGDVDGPPKRP